MMQLQSQTDKLPAAILESAPGRAPAPPSSTTAPWGARLCAGKRMPFPGESRPPQAEKIREESDRCNSTGVTDEQSDERGSAVQLGSNPCVCLIAAPCLCAAPWSWMIWRSRAPVSWRSMLWL